MFTTVVASLGQADTCSREVLQRWFLSANCKYTGTLAIKSFRELHSHTSYIKFFKFLTSFACILLFSILTINLWKCQMLVMYKTYLKKVRWINGPF
jgi:hypothetical protein